MHPSEAVSTGCQLRLHGGVDLAVLISTGERLRSTRAETGGLFVVFGCTLLRQFRLAASCGCMAALAWPFSFRLVRGYGARAPRREAEAGENGGCV